jgi:hypothetical protein
VPVKVRTPKDRRPSFTLEILALFAELDRQCRPNPEKERRLMRLLGLGSAFWTSNSVLDRSPGPCHPEGYLANEDWHRCRAARRALLAAVAAQKKKAPAALTSEGEGLEMIRDNTVRSEEAADHVREPVIPNDAPTRPH